MAAAAAGAAVETLLRKFQQRGQTRSQQRVPPLARARLRANARAVPFSHANGSQVQPSQGITMRCGRRTA